jgi:hypothetical protein
MKHISNSQFLVPVLFLLAACGGPKDIDKIADAQNCLDRATASGAAECVSKVEGIDSQGADLIRCVGKFVKEGFNDPTKLSTAMTGLSAGGNGTAGSTAMMAALAFSAESTPALNSTSSQEALTLCNKAQSKGLILLSGLAQTSTTLAVLGATNPATLTGAQLTTLMNTLATDPIAQTAVGSAVVAIYSSSCTGTGTTTGSFCTQFASAVATVPGGIADPAAIGAKIMACYTAPTTPGCSGF